MYLAIAVYHDGERKSFSSPTEKGIREIGRILRYGAKYVDIYSAGEFLGWFPPNR